MSRHGIPARKRDIDDFIGEAPRPDFLFEPDLSPAEFTLKFLPGLVLILPKPGFILGWKSAHFAFQRDEFTFFAQILDPQGL